MKNSRYFSVLSDICYFTLNPLLWLLASVACCLTLLRRDLQLGNTFHNSSQLPNNISVLFGYTETDSLTCFDCQKRYLLKSPFLRLHSSSAAYASSSSVTPRDDVTRKWSIGLAPYSWEFFNRFAVRTAREKGELWKDCLHKQKLYRLSVWFNYS